MRKLAVLVQAVAPVVRRIWLGLRNWHLPIASLLRRELDLQMLEPRRLLSGLGYQVYASTAPGASPASTGVVSDINQTYSQNPITSDQTPFKVVYSGTITLTSGQAGSYFFKLPAAEGAILKIDGTTVIYAPSIGGDANLDGTDDITDFNTVEGNYFMTGATWTDGDFNGDGTVDISDQNIVEDNELETASPVVIDSAGDDNPYGLSTAGISLGAGSHDIELDYFQFNNTSTPVAQLLYSTSATGTYHSLTDLSPNPYPGSVSGTVYNDVAAEQPGGTPAPLSGVAVYLDLNDNGSLDSGEPSTTTDSSGDYSFSSVPAGADVTIRAEAPSGYANEVNGSTNSDGSITVNLNGSQALTGVGFAMLRTLAPPQDLTATSASSSQVDLSWSDYNDRDSGTHVYYSVDGGAFSLLGTASAGATTFTASGLDLTSHNYSFRVAAYDTNGDSDYSNVAEPDAPTAKVTQIQMTVDDDSGTVSLKWIADQNTDFNVYRSDTSGVYATVLASSATLDADGHDYDYTFTDTDPAVGGNLHYRMVPTKNVAFGGGETISSGDGASSGDTHWGPSGDHGVWQIYSFPFNSTSSVFAYGGPAQLDKNCGVTGFGLDDEPKYEGHTADSCSFQVLSWAEFDMGVIFFEGCGLSSGGSVDPTGPYVGPEISTSHSGSGSYFYMDFQSGGGRMGIESVTDRSFASSGDDACGVAIGSIDGFLTQLFHYTVSP